MLEFRIIGLLILIFGQVLFLVRKLKIHPWLAPFFVVVFNTLILYFFALFNLLQLGYFFVLGSCAACAIFALIPLKRFPDKTWWSLPILAMIILAAFSWNYTRGMQFSQWDEFSHWGILFRYLLTENQLPVLDPTGPKSVFYISPPFTALFQYFVAKAIGNSEANAYFAQLLMQFFTIIALIRVVKWNQWFKYLLAFFSISIVVVGLDFGNLVLLVDLLLGLFFAVGLLQVLQIQESSLNEVIAIILSCSALILTKPIGVFFAIVVIFIYLFIQFMKISEMNNLKGAAVGFLRQIIQPHNLAIILIPVFIFISWEYVAPKNNQMDTQFAISSPGPNSSEIFPITIDKYIQNLIDQERVERIREWLEFQPSLKLISLTDIGRSFTNTTYFRNKLILSNILKSLDETKYESFGFSPKFVLINILILFGINLFLLLRAESKLQRLFVVVNVTLLLGLFLYLIVLFQAYIYQFPAYFGSLAPQLSRYLASYFLGFMVFNLIFLIDNPLNDKNPENERIAKWILSGVVLLGVVIIPANDFLHFPNSVDYYRARANRIYEFLNSVDFSENDKVYDVFQLDESDRGFNHNIIRYLLSPIPTNIHGWELGERTGDLDYFTVPYTPDEWMKLLHDQGYTYVLISSANDKFWSRYSILFNQFDNTEEGQLFRVMPNGLEKVLFPTLP